MFAPHYAILMMRLWANKPVNDPQFSQVFSERSELSPQSVWTSFKG